VQAQILDLLGEQRRERNMSLLLVTHDLGVVAGHTDDIGVMYGGKLVEMAPTTELFANRSALHRGTAAEHPEDRRPSTRGSTSSPVDRPTWSIRRPAVDLHRAARTRRTAVAKRSHR
jgi:ABC-type dipeptide/oligopeptide/nickel transport system ATPase component